MSRATLLAAAWALAAAAPASGFDLKSAIASAQAGETVVVPSGLHAGPVVVSRAVTLAGEPGAVVDGGRRGSVVVVTAPGAVIRGLTVTGTGTDLEARNAGIEVRAPDVVVENNVLRDVLLGITLDGAARGVVRGNTIRGMDLALGRRGDAIRLWESNDALIEGNEVFGARDVVVWYSSGVHVVQNRVTRGRYGVHCMYADDVVLEGNRLENNSVGAYLMYSREIVVSGNSFAQNRGPSGFGLGLKDVDGLSATQNRFVGNRVGVYIDNAPGSVRIRHAFEKNLFAYNDVGVSFLPAVRRNDFAENTFLENLEQVAVTGGGSLADNDFTPEGRGNFWSDYTGYDLDGDGRGDLPYRSRSLFENLMDREKVLRLFLFSPAQQTIELAAKALPIIQPRPKLEDHAPLMQAPVVPLEAAPAGARWPLVCFAGVLGLGSALALRCASTEERARGDASRDLPAAGSAATVDASGMASLVRIAGVSKRFGKFAALDRVDLDLREGEAVALWGRNGAGKTTAIRCLLGLHRFEGEILVAGVDVKRHGKEARRKLGYVPQELAFHDDMRADETLRFYARLKGVAAARTEEVLAEVGMAEHARKRIRELSGGMKQRIALAAALLADPPILVLDEMTSNLDRAGRAGFLRLLAELKRRGKTILFTSHRLDEVASLADRVVVLERGRVRATCAADELAEVLGVTTRLRLVVGRESVRAAADLLRAQGFEPSFNGGPDVRVRVAPGAKVAALRALERAGLTVLDFDVETDGAAEESGAPAAEGA